MQTTEALFKSLENCVKDRRIGISDEVDEYYED